MDNLQKIFSATPEETKTFADLLKKQGVVKWEHVAPSPEFKNLQIEDLGVGDSEATLKIKTTSKMTTLEQGNLFVTHGSHGNDYVWHLGPMRKPSVIPRKDPKPRTWQVPLDRLLFAVGTVLSEKVPNKILVDIYPPSAGRVLKEEVTIHELTVKARDFTEHFSFDNHTGERISIALMEACQSFV
jgi:hypothetical protein